MTDIATDLATLLRSIDRAGDFHTHGTVEIFAPGLEVEGVGPIALPLLPVQSEQLIAVATQAPYGRGEQTVIDTGVRRTWQINADQVQIRGRAWGRTLDGIVACIAEGLGVAEPIKADLYKLLVYDEGGFFLTHRDTEKTSDMFATLVIVLPSIYTGGELVIRHLGREARLDLGCSDPSEAAFAAFYADCEHEVLPVTSGCRLTLIYNLSCRQPGHRPQSPAYESERDRLAARLRSWADSDPAKLIYPLDHAYTPAALSFAALKGADAARAASLAAAAELAECDLHLALVTIEESGSAEYSGDWRRRRWHDDDDDEGDFEVIEVNDHSETLSEWRRPDGADAGLGPLPFDATELSPPAAFDDLAPTEQSFHEATGNEGASFERTYRRAALVLWPRRNRLAVVNQGGLEATLPALAVLAEGCGTNRLSLIWAEAHALSGLMLASWPNESWRPSEFATTFLSLLGRLGDVERIDAFLAEVPAAGNFAKVDAEAVARALALLPPARGAELAECIVTTNAAMAVDACADLLAQASADSVDLRSAGAALVAALPGGPARPHRTDPWGRPRTMEPGIVVDLLGGLMRIAADLADAALDTILAWPKCWDPDAVLIPALLTLERAAPARLREACRDHLGARIALPLAPPADWKRDDRLTCSCPHCRELGRFLADPTQKEWAFRAVQADRSHVESIIRTSHCDLDLATIKKGSPHSLICSKNQASYHRRARQHEADLENPGSDRDIVTEPGLRLTPAGHLLLEAGEGRLVAAFGRGSGYGLLHLGAAEVGRSLPPALVWWRDFAARYVVALCHQDSLLVPPPSEAEFATLVLTAPMMAGAEYLSADVLRSLWDEIGEAVAKPAAGTDLQTFLKGLNPAWNLVGRVHFNLAENRRDPSARSPSWRPTRRGCRRRPRRSTCRSARRCANTPAPPTATSCCRCCCRCSAPPSIAPGCRPMVDAGEIFHPLRWTPPEAARFLRSRARPGSRRRGGAHAGDLARQPPAAAAGDGDRRQHARPRRSASDGAARLPHGGDARRRTADRRGDRAPARRHRRPGAAARTMGGGRSRPAATRPCERFREAEELAAPRRPDLRRGDAPAGRRRASPRTAARGRRPTGRRSPPAPGWRRRCRRCDPPAGAGADPGPALKAPCGPISGPACAWLHLLSGLGLGACLADDMGLGKTIQVLALLLARESRPASRACWWRRPRCWPTGRRRSNASPPT